VGESIHTDSWPTPSRGAFNHDFRVGSVPSRKYSDVRTITMKLHLSWKLLRNGFSVGWGEIVTQTPFRSVEGC